MNEIDAGSRIECKLTQKLGIVLVRYVSEMSGLPLLSVLWDGSIKAELTLPETVRIVYEPYDPESWLRHAKGFLS